MEYSIVDGPICSHLAISPLFLGNLDQEYKVIYVKTYVVSHAIHSIMLVLLYRVYKVGKYTLIYILRNNHNNFFCFQNITTFNFQSNVLGRVMASLDHMRACEARLETRTEIT